MLSLLQSWKGTVEVDGKEYGDITNVSQSNFKDKPFHVLLLPEQHKTANNGEIQGDKGIDEDNKDGDVVISPFLVPCFLFYFLFMHVSYGFLLFRSTLSLSI